MKYLVYAQADGTAIAVSSALSKPGLPAPLREEVSNFSSIAFYCSPIIGKDQPITSSPEKDIF